MQVTPDHCRIFSIFGWKRFPSPGNGNPFQYSCLRSPKDRGAWRATIQGVAKSPTQVNNWTLTHTHTHTDTHTSSLKSAIKKQSLVHWSNVVHCFQAMFQNKFLINFKKFNLRDFPGGAMDKNPPANTGDIGSIPGPGRFHMLGSN